MNPDGSLTNQLLIAMPGMADPNFSTTVTLVCEHNDDGALGIVINRHTTLKLGGLFEQLDVDSDAPLTIGSGSNLPWKGQVDDVRIYKRTLTDKEIKALSNPALP